MIETRVHGPASMKLSDYVCSEVGAEALNRPHPKGLLHDRTRHSGDVRAAEAPAELFSSWLQSWGRVDGILDGLLCQVSSPWHFAILVCRQLSERRS